jgi:hypothetical protein
MGPSTAKTQFLGYVRDHARNLAGKVTGVETDDHPTDAQIVAHVKSHFRIPAPRIR